MFKQLKNGLSKLMTPKKLIIVIVFLLLAYLIYSYSSSKSMNLSGFNGSAVASSAAPAGGASGSNLPNTPSTAAPVFNNPSGVAEIGAGAGAESMAAGSASVGAGSSTNPSDLLPRDNNSAWSNLNPALQTGTGVQTPDLLQAGSLIGLDTIGQSLRNANLQLRSDPFIPRSTVGPWNNSTIEPDLIRAPFDINPSCGSA
jgi:hypothetical protein